MFSEGLLACLCTRLWGYPLSRPTGYLSLLLANAPSSYPRNAEKYSKKYPYETLLQEEFFENILGEDISVWF